MELRKRRLEKNWSQEQLAEISGVSSRTIQRIENGAKPGMETLKALAAGLEIPIEQLQQAEKGTDWPDEPSGLFGSIPKAWKSFMLNVSLFMIVETWVLFLSAHFEIGTDIPGAVALLWGAVLIVHLVMTIRKNP